MKTIYKSRTKVYSNIVHLQGTEVWFDLTYVEWTPIVLELNLHIFCVLQKLKKLTDRATLTSSMIYHNFKANLANCSKLFSCIDHLSHTKNTLSYNSQQHYAFLCRIFK